MAITHNLGFPRIGPHRELKFALERFWRGELDLDGLQQQGKAIRAENWRNQAHCDFVPVGDFSFYDHVLDTSFLLGHIPQRAGTAIDEAPLDQYFRIARGRSGAHNACRHIAAGEMTKWFDTNYHYIVPEITQGTTFELNAKALLQQAAEAKALGYNIKPVVLGPVSYLWLSKSKDEGFCLDHLEALLLVYVALLDTLAAAGVEWVQIDEPILVTELEQVWQRAIESSYHRLKYSSIKLLLTTYFGQLQENLQLACNLPVAGLHIDAATERAEVAKIVDWLPAHKVLSLGIINGRNVWKTDLEETLDWLEPIALQLKERLWLAPSCSLLHVPVDVDSEVKLDIKIKDWLAFAQQKLDELDVLKNAINHGRESVAQALHENAVSVLSRKQSTLVHDPVVRVKTAAITPALGARQASYEVRSKVQKKVLNLPAFPTTTIGSFPQTVEIRRARLAHKKGELNQVDYQRQMQKEIEHCIRTQETLGLDVLVHGEAERNDMVEYFGEQLNGYAFSEFGWVQSYGSRCVKPPIIYGDVSRVSDMTVEWIQYAQSLTQRPVKGMLTGPVTLLNWSFVRDDLSRRDVCLQIALAIREEVLALEAAGVNIIQIDEAALREGLPLRQQQWEAYLTWAVESFRICANGVGDETQIHTHMCYSEFNAIIAAIAHMDADVITIETSRSDLALLDVFDEFKYPNEIGPGVYDIHSPNIPTVEQVVGLMAAATKRISTARLWINPDCGLKTRRWEEVKPALANMVEAAKQLRKSYC